MWDGLALLLQKFPSTGNLSPQQVPPTFSNWTDLSQINQMACFMRTSTLANPDELTCMNGLGSISMVTSSSKGAFFALCVKGWS